MKKLAFLMVAVLTVIGTPAWAGSSATASASASVGAVLDLAIDIRALDGTTGLPTGSNLAPNMPFGSMVRNGNNAMAGQQALAVFLGVNSSSRKYAITTTMGAMTSGSNTLPNAMSCNVINAVDSNNADITGDVPVTGAKSAIMSTATTLYTSNTAGTSATVQVIYGISGGPAPFTGWAGVPPDQAAGTYSATATYTLALV